MLEKEVIDFEKSIVVGIVTQNQSEDKLNEYLDELEFLTFTAGGTVVKRFSQKMDKPNPKTFVGTGKLEEIKYYIKDNDINLTEPRLAIDFFPPIGGSALVYDASLNEPFTSYTTNNQQIFPKYINDAAVGSRYWQRKVFSGNTYIQMSSFGGTPEANRSLFIVPVNMTAASTMTFESKAGFHNGNVLKVYYSTNYVPGTQITSATLIDITSSFTISPGLPSGYPTNFTPSGVYNIPAGVTGNGFFIFEYVGNGTGITTTMQIDNIVIN